jgi:serine/threonine protein phosphatase PrpC
MGLEQVWILLLIAGVLFIAYYAFEFLHQKRSQDEFILSQVDTDIGNAQLLGHNDYQNDYFAVIEKENTLMAVVADGRGDKPDGKYTSVMAIEMFKKNFDDYLLNNDAKAFFNKSIFQLKKAISDTVTNNNTGVKLITLIIKQNNIEVLSIGDCVGFVVRNRQIIYINTLYNSDLLIKQFQLKNKDKVVICTRALFDGLSENELIHRIDTKQHPQYKCESIIKLVYNKKEVNGQNGTIIILENIKS